MKKRKISWDIHALKYFSTAIKYIRKESPQIANKGKREILKKIGELSRRPEIHPPDKFKTKNNGNYRAFELDHFRIGSLVKEAAIIIARGRNTFQAPLDY